LPEFTFFYLTGLTGPFAVFNSTIGDVGTAYGVALLDLASVPISSLVTVSCPGEPSVFARSRMVLGYGANGQVAISFSVFRPDTPPFEFSYTSSWTYTYNPDLACLSGFGTLTSPTLVDIFETDDLGDYGCLAAMIQSAIFTFFSL
jgi:hypothetical protein